MKILLALTLILASLCLAHFAQDKEEGTRVTIRQDPFDAMGRWAMPLGGGSCHMEIDTQHTRLQGPLIATPAYSDFGNYRWKTSQDAIWHIWNETWWTPSGHRWLEIDYTPPSTFEVWAKGSKWLSVPNWEWVLTECAYYNIVIDFQWDTRAGDVTGNNLVNAGDFNAYKAAAGCGVGQPCYNRQADFDNNGVVGIVEFGYINYNYGLGGWPDPSGTPLAGD